MMIDVTESSGRELIQILTNYPKGKLVSKQGRIFWDSLDFEPKNPSGAVRNVDPMQPPRGGAGEIGQRFERMADALGRMVC